MKPLGEVTAYGDVVPFRFRIVNEGTAIVFVKRVEAVAGRPWTVAGLAEATVLPLAGDRGTVGVDPVAGSAERVGLRRGLLLPGQALEVVAPYRVLLPQDRLAVFTEIVPRGQLSLRAWLPDPGVADRWHRATDERLAEWAATPAGPGRAPVLLRPAEAAGEPRDFAIRFSVPCPPEPFTPSFRGGEFEAWTFSLALDGFVVRHDAMRYTLESEAGDAPLPPLPFELLDDVDLRPGGVTVIGLDGRSRRVRAADLRDFLRERVLAGDRLVPDPRPGGTVYRVRR